MKQAVIRADMGEFEKINKTNDILYLNNILINYKNIKQFESIYNLTNIIYNSYKI
jgi:hypothetical protein